MKQTANRKKRLLRTLVLLLFLCTTGTTMAQNINVKGKVTKDDGLPLQGASVMVKGSTNGTTTNETGEFSISASANATLLISAVDFLMQEIKINNRTSVTVKLAAADKSLENVVVVGYGTQKKVDVTGAVARVNLEAMQNAPNTNIGQFLQGTVPGLNVGLSTFAGGTPPISIRGRVTISGSQNVLIILDGIQYTQSLSSINPDDIASIDVLKDASATAVYGAQAANGVILITTRKGRAGQKPRIAFSSAYTTQEPTVKFKPWNREQFLENMKDAFWNEAFIGPDYTQPNSAFNVTPKLDGSMRPGGVMLPNDYDWWGNSTKTGSILENNLSISGGGEKFSYLLSGGVVDQKGYIINDIFKRKTLRVNLEARPFSFWKVGVVSSGTFVNQDGAEPTMGIITISSPLLVPFDTAGNLIPSPTNTVVGNPFLTYYVDDYDRNQYYFANIYSDLDIPFIKGLNYRMNFGNNLRNSQHYFSSRYGGGLTGEAYKENQEYYDYTFDNILTYTKKFGRHDITATALYGAIERKFNRTFAQGTGFDRISLGYNNIQSANIRNITTNANSEALAYQMARVNYKFNDRYLITATLRRDGFSGFAQNLKYATFPSVGLGWIISDENFLKNVDFVSFLKLRATYGSIGNQTPRYTSLSQVATNSSYVYGDGGSTAFGQQVNTLSNPDLKWEKTQGLNFGLDFTLLKGRLTGSLEYYKNTTKDLIFAVTIPNVTGFGQIQSNVGKLNNTGFEAGITYHIINNRDFKWSATYNLWTNQNKIETLTGIDANGDGIEDDLVSSGLFIGKPLGAVYDYQRGPIYQLTDTRLPGFQVGSLSVVDQDKNGVINALDRTFMGQREEKYRMSLFNNLSYKGFGLSFFINSIQGGDDGYLANNGRLYFRDDNAIRNNDLTVVDYWSPRNPTGKYPRIISGSRSTVEPPMFESRSFVRLQDVSLSYNLPAKVLGKIKAQSINFYISAKNLATWTKWEGWDPETLVPITTNGVTTQEPNGVRLDGRPALRAFTFGVHITY
jgi:TonB-dependent starch-binding outer membrane protein SusC